MLKERPLVREDTDDPRKPKHRLITPRRMAVYPAIFFFVIIFSTVDRGYQLVRSKRNFYLALLDVVTSNLQGLLNSLVYGLTTAVRLEWIAHCFPTRGVEDKYVSVHEKWRGSSNKHSEPAGSPNDSTDFDYQLLRANKSSQG